MARLPLTPAEHLAQLERAAAGFLAVLETGDLDAPVPVCGPWRLTDLAHHLGGIHRWARTAVVEGPSEEKDPTDAPTDRAGLSDWFREGADALVATLRVTDPDTPCWTFAPPHTAVFWSRRQMHETAVHAHDAAASQGTARAYGAELAVDGIDEVVGTFFPRQVRLGRIPPLPSALAVEPAEGGRWVLAGDGRGGQAKPSHPTGHVSESRRAWPLWERATTDAPATVSGPAEALLLLLWHRTTPDDPRVTVAGDRLAAETVLATALTS